MPRIRSPKRGSMAYSPRKRAKKFTGRVKYWPPLNHKPGLVGFAGYKVGMTHLYHIEERRRVPEYGQEIKSSATIIDAPPLIVVAMRVYKQTFEGLKCLTEVWTKNQPKDLSRRINFPADPQTDMRLDEIRKLFDKIVEIRVLVATQPRLTGVPKKSPDLMEIPVKGGSIGERFEYAEGLLGQTITIKDVFKPGESVDVIGVTKGKGFQGPVKRWGIRILSRKSRKSKRAVASIGPWVPRRVMPQVPRAGQMGFHNRTEYNKRIMLMGTDNERVNPKEGFKRYGYVNGDYLLIKGSVMGPPKRLIKIRKAVREASYPENIPQITYLHTEFKGK
jgi:large subunit ribosomal protein L3